MTHKNTGAIFSIAWLDSDTKLILGTETGLVIADIITNELFTVSTPQWGRVTALKADERTQLLVYGTATGKAALLNMRKGFDLKQNKSFF